MSTPAPATSTTSNIPRINEPAPDFEAKSTQGMLKLSDYKGQWVVLFFHPAASETATVRAVFVIDDKGIIRALIYYPMSLGRNIDEILRVVDALQTADTNACATPANWRPGDKVVVPPPQTIADAEKRLQSDYEITDWYLAKRTLS